MFISWWFFVLTGVRNQLNLSFLLQQETQIFLWFSRFKLNLTHVVDRQKRKNLRLNCVNLVSVELLDRLKKRKSGPRTSAKGNLGQLSEKKLED